MKRQSAEYQMMQSNKIHLIHTKHHDPFDVEGYVEWESLTPSVHCIRHNNARPDRNFTVNALELLDIEHEIVKVDIDFSGIINGYYTDSHFKTSQS